MQAATEQRVRHGLRQGLAGPARFDARTTARRHMQRARAELAFDAGRRGLDRARRRRTKHACGQDRECAPVRLTPPRQHRRTLLRGARHTAAQRAISSLLRLLRAELSAWPPCAQSVSTLCKRGARALGLSGACVPCPIATRECSIKTLLLDGGESRWPKPRERMTPLRLPQRFSKQSRVHAPQAGARYLRGLNVAAKSIELPTWLLKCRWYPLHRAPRAHWA